MRDPLVHLLLSARRGDQAAARLLWETISPALTGLAQSILADHAAAEDALQRVFCAALTLPKKRIIAIEDLTAYLAAAIRNDALNQRRESVRRTSRERSSRKNSSAAARADTPNADSVPDPDLARALDAMSESDREIIVLKHTASLTFEQIALVLDMNRNTIASRYRAALNRLRQNLSHDDPVAAQPSPKPEVSNAR